MCGDMEVGQSKAHVRLARALSRRQPVANDRSGSTPVYHSWSPVVGRWSAKARHRPTSIASSKAAVCELR